MEAGQPVTELSQNPAQSPWSCQACRIALGQQENVVASTWAFLFSPKCADSGLPHNDRVEKIRSADNSLSQKSLVLQRLHFHVISRYALKGA